MSFVDNDNERKTFLCGKEKQIKPYANETKNSLHQKYKMDIFKKIVKKGVS